jgi:hypothetical protein
MINASSPIISLSIAGTDNVMADVASRAFGPKNECTDMHQHADDEFLLMFNARFPLPQGGSWTMFQFPSKLTTLVISELRKGPLNLGSWLRTTKNAGNIGRIGPTLPPTVVWSRNSKTPQQQTRLQPSRLLLNGSGQAIVAAEAECELRPFRSRFAPSARPANWTDCQTQSTEVKDDTSNH